MPNQSYPGARKFVLNSQHHLQQLAHLINSIRQGQLNITRDIEFESDTTYTTIIDSRISGQSALFLMPRTADAAALAPTVYWTDQVNGEVVVNYPSTISNDLKFRLIIIG